MFFPACEGVEPRVHDPRRLLGGFAEARPLLFVPATDRAPPAFAARVTPVGGCPWVAIPIAMRDGPGGRVVHERAAQKLHARFVLGEIDVHGLTSSPPMIQTRKNGGSAKSDSDEIHVGSINGLRRAVRLA